MGARPLSCAVWLLSSTREKEAADVFWSRPRIPPSTVHHASESAKGQQLSFRGCFWGDGGPMRAREAKPTREEVCACPHVMTVTVLPPALEGITVSSADTRRSSCLVFGVQDGESRSRKTLSSLEGQGGREAAGRMSRRSPRPPGWSLGAAEAPGCRALLSPSSPSLPERIYVPCPRSPRGHKGEALSSPSKSPQPSEVLSQEPQITSQQDET